MASLIAKKLMKLPIGASVELTYDEGDVKNQKLIGVVSDNDGEESLEIRTREGDELIIDYSLVRSFKTVAGSTPTPAPAPVPKPIAGTPTPPPAPAPKPVARKPLYQQESVDTLNLNDGELKSLFDRLPLGDKKRLSGVFDSFRYSVRVNDRSKLSDVANQARQILLREDEKRYYWSDEAVDFCGALLRRANLYDSEVCLIAERFYEAAFCAQHNKEYQQAGLYAITALLEKGPDHIRDLFAILADAIVKSNDLTGLEVLLRYLPEGMEQLAAELICDLFTAKGITVGADRDWEADLKLLRTLYTEKKMGVEVVRWLPEDLAEAEKKRADAERPAPVPVPKPAPKPVAICGTVTRVDWSGHTGTIQGDDGKSYTFRYQDITTALLRKEIEENMRADLGGKFYDVKFFIRGTAAYDIEPYRELVERARSVAAGSWEGRFAAAYGLCKRAVEQENILRAAADLPGYAIGAGNNALIAEAVALCERSSAHFPANANAYMELAQCCSILKKNTQALEYAGKALDLPGQAVRPKLNLLQQYLKLAQGIHGTSGDRKLVTAMLSKIREFREDYSRDIESNQAVRNTYINVILAHRIRCECILNLLAEAEADFAQLPGNHPQKAAMAELLEQTRQRVKPEPEPVPEAAPEPVSESVSESESEPEAEPEPIPEPEPWEPEPEEEPEEEEPVVLYADTDGWEALKLTKEDVVNYALGITGPDRIAPMLAYLRVGAALNPELKPVYHTVALAANDPMETLDYSASALMADLTENDTAYPALNDLCMGAAFLRSSFLYGKEYDFTTKSLRDSLVIDQQMQTLHDVCDTLEQFRNEANRPIDIYAEYRNRDQLKSREELAQITRYAEELYLKYILTPPREGAKFRRILTTKQIVFDKEAYLATMLRRIVDRDMEALENEKEHFIAGFLKGSGQLADMYISNPAVDKLIEVSWEEAGRRMQMEKATATLQGELRNNLRSNISDVLRTILRWYAVAEQAAGLTWQTDRGAKAYAQLRPKLLEQLDLLVADCDALREACDDPQRSTGLFLLGATARELRARLDNSWTVGQEKFLYVDFLRSSHICLDEDYMPDLSATFCVLPEFNILHRIRRHVEEPRLSWQEQIDRIYGPDLSGSNYGAADQIADYLTFLGQGDSITFPENRDAFINHTVMQIDIRYRGFLETYALAMNCGQIIKSDAFCYSLEDTVRYWNRVCRGNRSYGFFSELLRHAENQIHTCARQYEEQLEEQLDALISRNQAYFDKNPDYADAIREQIANQNFTVAEDWMARIRIGDFSLEMRKPYALTELDNYFSAKYINTYTQVADASQTLGGLLGRRHVRNKDTKRAQQLIDTWISSGTSASTERIRQLLTLLGWPNIQVTQITHPTNPRAELFQVTSVADQNILTAPQHPIAAFGSELEKPRDPNKQQQNMYVACLYGIYDCERLYDQMRILDGIEGSKIILLDWALSQSERRILARRLKYRGSSLSNVNLVIDRVLIKYLADNYNENLINRILMATAMPFSYYQPYVVDSIQTMPPEIFIGRQDELRRIERYDGVNLIYGGRQLGKSALFKKAVSDLDGRNNQRAIRVVIQDLDCAAAARKVSAELIDQGILPGCEVTDDWQELCRCIKSRLRAGEEISYFLLMLDEADAFISNCASCNYQPLVALKDVQESLPKRFKYVLAGLHDIVKFNRDVALGRNSVITHMSSLKITPFLNPEAEELLTKPLSYLGFYLPSKVTVSQILATCNYFPGLIQLYAQKLIESVRAADYAGYDDGKSPPYVVSDEHLRRVMSDKEFVQQIHEKFEITLKLDEDQGSCYYPLALLIGWMYNVANSKSGYTAQDVYHHARDLQIAPLNTLDVEKIDALLQELQDLNILRSVSNNSYLLASKNFRDLLGSDEEIFEKLQKIGGSEA